MDPAAAAARAARPAADADPPPSSPASCTARGLDDLRRHAIIRGMQFRDAMRACVAELQAYMQMHHDTFGAS